MRQRVIPIPSDSEEDIEEEEAHISDQEISNDEGEEVVKRGTKKGPPERDAQIDIFEFELHWRCHFEEKDVDKNVEFKKINVISYDTRFSFAGFFEKQVEKARLHVVEMFGVNTICQVVKMEAEVKFNRATKADFASLKLDIGYLPMAGIPIERLLKHRYKLRKNQLLVNLELHFAQNRSGIINVPPKPLSANQTKAQASATQLKKEQLQQQQFKDSQFLNQKHLPMED